MRLTETKLLFTVLALLVLMPSTSFGQKPEWQGHIDWAANDTGEPNCKEIYLSNPVLQECLVGGILTGNAGYGTGFWPRGGIAAATGAQHARDRDRNKTRQ